jgi:hypothetical protein
MCYHIVHIILKDTYKKPGSLRIGKVFTTWDVNDGTVGVAMKCKKFSARLIMCFLKDDPMRGLYGRGVFARGDYRNISFLCDPTRYNMKRRLVICWKDAFEWGGWQGVDE